MLYNISHRADHDGICSAAILKKKMIGIKTILADYNTINEDIDLSIFKKDDIVIITDFCLDIKDMKYLTELCKVIWIDHHASSIKKIDEANIKFHLRITRTDISACGLTWQYCYPSSVLPKAIEYLTKYDSWTHNGNKQIIYFNFGLYSWPEYSVDNRPLWEAIFQSNPMWMERIIQRGEAVFNYLNMKYKNIFKEYGFECEIDNHSTYVINFHTGNTLFFNELLKKYDIVITYQYDGKNDQWKLGAYSDILDVTQLSSIEFKGHPGAAGNIIKGNIINILDKLKKG